MNQYFCDMSRPVFFFFLWKKKNNYIWCVNMTTNIAIVVDSPVSAAQY